jgi:membrane protein involved in colicin uptake
VLASLLPVMAILYWAVSQVEYKAPERPQIDYISSFDPERTESEIIASNRANQELKDLREAEEERISQRKRDMYKALGAAAGMDVDEIERKAEAERAAKEAAEAKKRTAPAVNADPAP